LVTDQQDTVVIIRKYLLLNEMCRWLLNDERLKVILLWLHDWFAWRSPGSRLLVLSFVLLGPLFGEWWITKGTQYRMAELTKSCVLKVVMDTWLALL